VRGYVSERDGSVEEFLSAGEGASVCNSAVTEDTSGEVELLSDAFATLADSSIVVDSLLGKEAIASVA
jgi:hypothetical protein